MSQLIQDFLGGQPFGDGNDGVYSSTGSATDAPIDSSCSGTSGTSSLSATNASFAAGQIILIHQSRGTGVGNWEVNKIQSYVAGTITTSANLANTYTDSGASQAQVVVIKRYSSFIQNSGHTLTAKAWDGNVGGVITFACNGDTTITGSIVTSAKGFLGGNGTGNACYSGEGTSGDRNSQTSPYGNAGGGGVAANAGGAGGGNGTAGTDGAYAGGAVSGNAGLTSSTFGGGGATGGVGTDPGGNGGEGAGAVFIFAKNITITGAITLAGANGTNSTGGDYSRAGGGGAGGSNLIKAQTATLGTTLITAAAGAGGIASGGTNGNINGAAGGVGRIHLDYSISYTGTTNPTLDVTLDSSLVETGGSFLTVLLET